MRKPKEDKDNSDKYIWSDDDIIVKPPKEDNA